jgi:hypothetical protein
VALDDTGGFVNFKLDFGVGKAGNTAIS